MPHANSGTFHTYFSMHKLLFSGLLGSPTPEATPKFYPLHTKLRMKSLTIFPLRSPKNYKSTTSVTLLGRPAAATRCAAELHDRVEEPPPRRSVTNPQRALQIIAGDERGRERWSQRCGVHEKRVGSCKCVNFHETPPRAQLTDRHQTSSHFTQQALPLLSSLLLSCKSKRTSSARKACHRQRMMS